MNSENEIINSVLMELHYHEQISGKRPTAVFLGKREWEIMNEHQIINHYGKTIRHTLCGVPVYLVATKSMVAVGNDVPLAGSGEGEG